MKTRLVLAFGVVAVPLLGCAEVESEVNRILGSDYDITVTGQTPDVTFDLGEQVRRVEDRINDRKNNGGDDTRNYNTLKILCETEPGADCTTARFPARIPRFAWPAGCIVTENNLRVYKQPEQCTMALNCERTDQAALETFISNPNPASLPAGNGCVDVEEWLSSVDGFEDMTKIAQATNLDLSEQGSLKGVKQVKKVIVNSVVMKFKDNGLTYAVPLSRYYVGEPVTDSQAQNAKQLIADGEVVEFGTLPEAAAMFNGNRTMTVNTAGKALLSDALISFRAALAAQAELVVPPVTDDALADNCKDPTTTVVTTPTCQSFPKPGGTVKLAVELTVTFTVNPSGN